MFQVLQDTHARLRKTAQQTKKLPRMKFKLIRDEDEDLVDIVSWLSFAVTSRNKCTS